MNKILGVDTETVLRNRSHAFYSFQAFPPGYLTYSKEDVNEFFRDIEDGTVLLSAGAEFDTAILRKVLDNSFKIKCLFNKSLFLFSDIEHENKKIKLYDLHNLFARRSLKKIGEMVELEKMKKPKWLGVREAETEHEKKYFERYAIRDAEVSYRAGEYLLKKFGHLSVSLPALAIKTFSKNFNGAWVFHTFEEMIENKLKLAYRGGRTESWWRGTVPEKVYVFDKNSLYPFVCWKNTFPIAGKSFIHKSSVNLGNEGIAHVQVKVDSDIPLLGIKKLCPDSFVKLIFPNGTFSGWFTYPELRALEFSGDGKILKVLEAFEWRERHRAFKKFIEHYFELKNLDVKNKDFWKIFINSFYGKFAQNAQADYFLLKRAGQKCKKVKLESPFGEFQRRNYVIASYITAYARLEMWKNFKKIGSENLIYTDTDSIHTTKKLREIEGMGGLKLEKETDGENRATYIRSKFYILNNLLVCRGCQRIIRGNDMRELIKKNKVEVFVKGLSRLKTSMVRQFDFLTEFEMLKHFSTKEDYKRCYDKHLIGAELLNDLSKSKAVFLSELAV